MTIGSLLLQPQPLNRYSRFSYDQSFGDDALTLLQKIAMNPEWVEILTAQVGDEMGDFIAGLQQHIESRMHASQAAMQQMLNPLIGGIEELIDDDLDIQTVGDALDLILKFADKIAAFIETIDLDKIRTFVQQALDILFDTFGFNQDYLQDMFCQFIDIVIVAMEKIPDDASNEQIELQAQIVALARRLKREILNDVPQLEFNSETIARLLLNQLRELGLDTIQEKASCFADKVRAMVDAGTSIYDLAKAAEGGGSVGAALTQIDAISGGKQYCWYASWLYQKRRRTRAWQYFGSYLLPMVPKDEVWISEDGTKLILRHATCAKDADERLGEKDEVLYAGSGQINWYDADQFSKTTGQDEHFTFAVFSPNFMEQWTRVMAIVVNYAKLNGHIIHATEPGNHLTHSILSGWFFSRWIAEVVTGAPFTSFIRDKLGLGTAHKSWIDMVFQWCPIFGGSFEGFNTNSAGGFQHWITLLGDDAHDSFLIYLWPTLAHEGMLSIFTLLNQSGSTYTDFSDTNKPKNFEYSFPLTNVWLVFYSWLQSRTALKRVNYSHPFEETHMGQFALNQFLYSWMFGALAGITGELCGWAFSRQVSPRRLLIQMGWGAYKGFGTYIISSYFWNEGDTDGGRYNPTNAIAEGTEFNGYPDPDTSPYRLPIADGRPIFVGQANQGMFSHFVDGGGTIQIYAADFAHAFQEPIVAIRDGTVVDYFDWISDDIDPDDDQEIAAGLRAFNSGFLQSHGNGDQTGSDFDPANPRAGDVPGWNFIIIQHNDPFGRETTDEKGHDLDEGGTAVTTYAIYGHGANSGVREIFDTRGVAPADIIGQEVRRGEEIMWAGDTGVSFHNHLHLHVRPGPASVPSASRPDTTKPDIVSDDDLDAFAQRTIPIVFKDATHPLKSNGRLHHLTWYRSKNKVVT